MLVWILQHLQSTYKSVLYWLAVAIDTITIDGEMHAQLHCTAEQHSVSYAIFFFLAFSVSLVPHTVRVAGFPTHCAPLY